MPWLVHELGNLSTHWCTRAELAAVLGSLARIPALSAAMASPASLTMLSPILAPPVRPPELELPPFTCTDIVGSACELQAKDSLLPALSAAMASPASLTLHSPILAPPVRPPFLS